VPAANVLPGDTELAGNLGLGVAGGEQLTGLHADAFERLTVAQAAGVAAVGGWSHTAILPGQPPILSSELANGFRAARLKTARLHGKSCLYPPRCCRTAAKAIPPLTARADTLTMRLT
jgi:hypothetical protein